jgi:purine-binding chemotaxis protein CheW
MTSSSIQPPASAALEGTYLTFSLAGEEYAVPILLVRELVAILPVTVIPGSAAAVSGVCNLRGRVIPVVSLRTRFHMPAVASDPHSVFIIVEHGTQLVGLAVDSVLEVIAVKSDDIEALPNFGLDINSAFVKALAKNEGRIRILLDLAKVLDLDFDGAVEPAPAAP